MLVTIAASFSHILNIVLMVFAAILALGVVVIIHELGHFFAARRAGVKVEAFSIGFGPKLWSIKKGEIEYRISLLFIAGGYVKMKGMEPEGGKPPHEIEGGFFAASPGRRAFIAFAAPAMNLVLALAVFTLLWFTGTKVPQGVLTTTIGYLEEESPARKAGLVPGDTILKVNGEEVREWKDIMEGVAFSPRDAVDLAIRRDSTIVEKTVLVEWDKQAGFRHLSTYPRMDLVVSEVEKGSLAEKLQIRPGDTILHVAGERIYHIDQFREILRKNIGKQVDLVISRRDGSRVTASFTVPLPEDGIGVMSVEKGSLAKKAGFRSGDVIVAAAEQKVFTVRELQSVLSRNAGNDVKIQILRGKRSAFEAGLKKPTGDVVFGAHLEESFPILGFIPGPVYGVRKEDPFSATYSAVRNVLQTLKALVTRTVSTKGISGPVGIVGMIAKSISISFTTFLHFIGFLSANFAVINLLPIPIVDGGHIMFCAIEKLRRKPIRQRTMTVIVNAFFILILAFFLLVTRNDVVRFLRGGGGDDQGRKKVTLLLKAPAKGLQPPSSESGSPPSEK